MEYIIFDIFYHGCTFEYQLVQYNIGIFVKIRKKMYQQWKESNVYEELEDWGWLESTIMIF